MTAENWTATLIEIKRQIESVSGEKFNSVLINLYRDGQDSNGWHADDEPELGEAPVIASLSLGATRDFDLRLKQDHTTKARLALQHGSLLIMRGSTQQYWQHQIPKRSQVGARVNLTFRTVYSNS
jgi:alkylated DNA repair dioxygenase AlkB